MTVEHYDGDMTYLGPCTGDQACPICGEGSGPRRQMQAALVYSNVISRDGERLSKDAVLGIAKQLGWRHGDGAVPDDGILRLEAAFEILDSHLDDDGVQVIDKAKLIEVSVVGARK